MCSPPCTGPAQPPVPFPLHLNMAWEDDAKLQSRNPALPLQDEPSWASGDTVGPRGGAGRHQVSARLSSPESLEGGTQLPLQSIPAQ